MRHEPTYWIHSVTQIYDNDRPTYVCKLRIRHLYSRLGQADTHTYHRDFPGKRYNVYHTVRNWGRLKTLHVFSQWYHGLVTFVPFGITIFTICTNFFTNGTIDN